ncbi:MAG: trypsin-like peptidase domain-containing protein [Caldilineaceae bacterium]|nr:trypsin-like peptidase domain-containing protein [Caldilineaceae bacterium]
MDKKKLILWVLWAALALSGCTQAGLLTFSATATPPPAPTWTPTPFPPPSVAGTNETAQIDAAGLDIAERRVIDVYDRVAPSVVNVTTQVLRRGFFFDVIPEEGAGSGFVLDLDGHVLTNFHVIDGAQQIEVTLGNEQTFPAQVVGSDPRFDLAILKVDAPAEILHPVALGESSSLRVGQRAIVIGNPFGQFSRTLTTGVVSALDRTLEGQDGRPISGVIQTDAAINRGNSGGPLLDSSGRVIGINTAIFSPSGTNAGVGFAVPVDTIKRVLPELMELGRYRHPYLGIRYAYAITPGLAQSLDLPVDTGLLLVQLDRGSPLEQADVRGAQRESILGNRRVYIGGDILVSVNGTPIQTVEELQLWQEQHEIGNEVTVALLRGGEMREVVVALTEEPAR